LQSIGWTSHRAYLAKEIVPEWLNTSYFQTVFDSPEALHSYVLDLHRGKLTWPERMAMDTGWLVQSGERAPEKISNHATTSFQTSEEVLTRICKVTGATREKLLVVRYGPGANPARRFAVWALKRDTLLTYREIGHLLDMTVSQIGHVLSRMTPKTGIAP
jgi:hypothetical protein